MGLNEVYKKIEDNNIKIFPFGVDGIKAVTIETDNRYGIFMNKKEIKDVKEEFCVLAHEYGHCASGSTHRLYSPLDLICRHEYKADRKAIIDFVPIDRIKDAIQCGCKTVYEFSDYLDLPEAFVSKALQHYTVMELI